MKWVYYIMFLTLWFALQILYYIDILFLWNRIESFGLIKALKFQRIRAYWVCFCKFNVADTATQALCDSLPL